MYFNFFRSLKNYKTLNFCLLKQNNFILPYFYTSKNTSSINILRLFNCSLFLRDAQAYNYVYEIFNPPHFKLKEPRILPFYLQKIFNVKKRNLRKFKKFFTYAWLMNHYLYKCKDFYEYGFDSQRYSLEKERIKHNLARLLFIYFKFLADCKNLKDFLRKYLTKTKNTKYLKKNVFYGLVNVLYYDNAELLIKNIYAGKRFDIYILPSKEEEIKKVVKEWVER